jgi:magnesium transporter
MQKLHYPPPGSAPTAVPVSSESETHPTQIKLIEYDAHSFVEKQVSAVGELEDCVENQKVSWVNIEGLGSVETVQELGRLFQIHPLAITDILTLGQRPHLDAYDRQIFLLLQMVYSNPELELVFEQLSILIGDHFVLTFQEEPGHDVFEPVRTRLREGAGNARFLRNDYLAYTLIDTVLDHYFPAVEKIGEAIEGLEEALLERPTRANLRQVHEIRGALALLRRAVWPQRDVLLRLWHDESGLLSDRTKPFIRDTYDHALALIDLLESYRDATVNFMELYISGLTMRTNEIVRVLTVISSIFIPLTFIAGVYGMNFDRSSSVLNMPELGSPIGYPAVLLVMAAVAGGMLLYFKRKRWL